MRPAPASQLIPSATPGYERRLYDLVLRQSFGAFAEKVFRTLNPGQVFLPNWHIDLLCDDLERVRCGEVRRRIINLPPRGLKSMLVSIAFPAFVLGHDPIRRIIVTSMAPIWRRSLAPIPEP